MYILGGARTKGNDKYGNEAEVDWGMPSINYWRSVSTADGETFKCDTLGMKVLDHEGLESDGLYELSSAYFNVATIKDKMFIQGGYYFGFGMAQGARRYAYTTDGKNWNAVTPTSSDPDFDVTRRNAASFFTFKGKLWCVGGFTNYIGSQNYMRTNVYSSADGLTWEKAGELTGAPAMYHAKVIAGDDVAFMIGGEYVDADGSTHVLSNKVYRTTDGVNWTEVTTVPSNFEGVRGSAGVALGNTAFIFGGNKTAISDMWGFPLGASDVFSTDTWIKLIK